MFCEVYLLDAPYPLDHPFDYLCPPEEVGTPERGDLVSVPFGRADRLRLAVVTALRERSDADRPK